MLYIVSGLPRSGTSMLMKMLAAGGMDILTDDRREADDDNPKGYFEYEPVMNLAQDASWVEDWDQKVIKVISHLLPYLPSHRPYKVIFVLRPLQEILISQQRMLQRKGQVSSYPRQDRMYAKFSNHLFDIRLWLARQAHFDSLFVNYPDIVASPLDWAARISEFVGGDCDLQHMAETVDPRLYRNRKE